MEVQEQLSQLNEDEFLIFYPYRGKRNTIFMVGNTSSLKRGMIIDIWDDIQEVDYTLKIKLVRKKEVWADLIAN